MSSMTHCKKTLFGSAHEEKKTVLYFSMYCISVLQPRLSGSEICEASPLSLGRTHTSVRYTASVCL